MAAVQERNGSFRILFRYQRQQHTFTLGRVSRAEAEAKAGAVDYLLMRLEQGLIELPQGARIVEFVQHDGRIPAARPIAAPEHKTLAILRDRYLETHAPSLEYHTVRGLKRHFKHFTSHFGEDYLVGTLTLADLQAYVAARAKARWRSSPISPATVRKELVTLRTAWRWGVRMGFVEGRFPGEGLRYAKLDEKPPFQTRAEINRQIQGLSAARQKDLWASLYLTLDEIAQLLEHVRRHALHPWIYPLVATTAHTGARKSELLRFRVADVDLEGGFLTIHERKRVHDRRTTRRVPLSDLLADALREWLKVHPGGSLLFAHATVVSGSKKRSAAARCEQVVPLTEEELHHHLKLTLKGSEWDVVRGYHVLRHSFVSACASRGVDQRLIDEWVGHTTEEMRRRYRHLYPDAQSAALKNLFA